MGHAIRWAQAVAVMVLVGIGFGEAAGKTKPASAKSAEKQESKPRSFREDSLEHARSAQERRLRVEAHQKQRREEYLARMTPEQRKRAEEVEQRRSTHLRVQDSLNLLRENAEWERLRKRAEEQKGAADNAKKADAGKSAKKKK